MNIDYISHLTDSQNIKEEVGDYYEDGLLYCGKCYTRKQTRVQVAGVTIEPLCLCKCEAENRQAKRAEIEVIQRQQKIIRMRSECFPDSQMGKWTFDKSDGEEVRLLAVAGRYVLSFDEHLKNGKGLLLWGQVGTGKTYLAACIANALIDKGIPCLVTSIGRISNKLQGMYEGKQDYIDSLRKYKLIIFDDLASERGSAYMNEQVYNIINARYESGLPFIVTTNLSLDEMKKSEDISRWRIYDRILERCFPVEVNGKSKRRQKIRDEYEVMKECLGYAD